MFGGHSICPNTPGAREHWSALFQSVAISSFVPFVSGADGDYSAHGGPLLFSCAGDVALNARQSSLMVRVF
jgi:hypothetical protein